MTRIRSVFKENLVKYKGKKTSREYTFILFKGKRTKIFCSYGAMIVSSLSKCYQYFTSNEASNTFKMFR